MCGLHGILTVKYERNADDFLASAFVAGSVRGRDSSGLAIVDLVKEEYEVHKLPIAGTFFSSERVALRMMREASRANTLAMGHTRHATVGGVSVDTSHPFECYEGEDRVLVGAHNGTLQNWKTKKGGSLYEVDSEWALNHIMAVGPKAFEDFAGAYCFTWWDSAEAGTFNIARNTERSLYIVMLKTGGMAYASEAGMLYWLCERHGVEMEGPVLEIAAGQHYKFPVDKPTEFTKESLPGKKASPIPDYHGHSSRTHWKNEVEKVEELLEKVSKLSSAQPNAVLPALPAPKSPSVDDKEYQAAVNLGLLGQRVEFIPMQNYGETVDGVAAALGADYEAEVRGWNGNSIDEFDSWFCFVIGIHDTGSDMKLILGTPSLRQKKKETTVH